MHKRKIIAVLVAITVTAVILLSACKKTNYYQREYRQNSGKFSVHYLDVGNGDCTLIYFPDGKCMVIDTGNGKTENDEHILEFLEKFSITRIDYLVLTHPDIEHIGGTQALSKAYEIGRAYLPFVVDKDKFLAYKKAYNALSQKSVEIKTSCLLERITGEEYAVAFLTPNPPHFSNSSYDKLLLSRPTESDINNVSPIIYVEYKGVRFLFTGDAESSQEEQLLDDEMIIISSYEKLGISVNLSDIDFLKVSNHGSNEATSKRFVERITPKNAIISVGGGNKNDVPSSQVIARLIENNEGCGVYRTDVLGTVSVTVNNAGEIFLEK